jgi:hypothetical protein
MAGEGKPTRARAQRPQEQQRPATHREGSRWIGEFPDPAEVAAWFADNVQIHEELEHDHYVQGVTMISQQEKVKRLVGGEITEVERLVHVPYVKVETRVAYFWDLMAVTGQLGVIEPVGPRYEGVPPGFFFNRALHVRNNATVQTVFLCNSQKVTVYEADLRSGGKGRVVKDAPPAVKQIAVLDRWGKPDPHAFMKAETGAVGRALGMAGILVMPGSGVATAEDMQEALAPGGGQGSAEPAEAELPTDAPAPAEDPRAKIATLSQRLQSEAPGKFEEVQEWAADRQPPIDLNDIKDTQLRAVLGQLERKVATLDQPAA